MPIIDNLLGVTPVEYIDLHSSRLSRVENECVTMDDGDAITFFWRLAAVAIFSTIAEAEGNSRKILH